MQHIPPPRTARPSPSLRTSKPALIAALGAVLIGMPACGHWNDSAETVAPGSDTSELGRVSLSLRARGQSGTEYRLRRATFLAGDPALPAPDVELSTEENPDADQLTANMRPGEFIIVLVDGWELERLDPVPTPVEARLVSDPIQPFTIVANEDTFVSYRFETDNDVIDLELGRLVVELEVEETGDPTPPPPPPPQDCPFVNVDSLYAQMQQDVLSQDADDRSFIRYVSFADRALAGVCGSALDLERFGLAKLLNSVSMNARIEEPRAIDVDELIFRIDVRDYGWDRELEVQGELFEDGWQALLAHTTRDIEFEGDEAEMLILQTETNVPWLPASALAETLTQASVYAGFLDIPDSLQQLALDELGVDREDNAEQLDMVRAAVSSTPSSTVPLLIERNDIEVRAGSLWIAQEVADELESPDQLLDTDLPGSARVLYQLPNSLPAFAAYDEERLLAPSSRFLIDDPAAASPFTPLACLTCHAEGPLPAVDELRPFALSNPIEFDAETFENILDMFPEANDFARFVEQDADEVRAALNRASVPTNLPVEPITEVVSQFQQELFLVDAAGELMVSQELLLANIGRFDPQLQVLAAGGSVSRSDFEALFREALCTAQTFSQNRPVCDL